MSVEANETARRSGHMAIGGLNCASCVGRVERAIAAVPGVSSVSVNLATGRADVAFDGAPDMAGVAAAVRGAGFEVPEAAINLAVDGLNCASCVGRAEKALRAVPGVLDASVNLATGRAHIRVTVGAATADELAAAVTAAGYAAGPLAREAGPESGGDTREADDRGLRNAVIVAGLLTLPVFVMEMGAHAVPAFGAWLDGTLGTQAVRAIQFLLTTAVLFGPGLRFFRKGVPGLLRGAPDMNALVVLGASAAWGYSVVATFLPGLLPAGTAHVYYEAAAVIVTLILLGRYLEARAKGRTGEAIRRLAGLRASSARLLREGGPVDVPLEEVAIGDIVLVRPGETVPVDGEIVEGSSYLDESMITGEPMPVARSEGEEIVGGTINKTGAFCFRATKVGSDTVLARIIRMVEDAQAAKLPIQALVDRVTAWFVPAVIAAAALTFAVWLVFGPAPALTFALVNAVAVLIIACPCAMGLATPTSIMVGTGRAAQMGVLFRKGEALQTLRDADVVAFDKTGTLTLGKPVLAHIGTADGFAREEVLRLVAAAEALSEHPVAEAIVAAAGREDIALAPASDFEAMPGFGLRAHVEGRTVEVGADRLMARSGIDVEALRGEADRLSGEGASPLYAAIDGRLAAILAVSDPVRETTPEAVAALREQGLGVVMVTGDNRHTAQAIAARLGIDDVIAEVLPEGKVEAVKRLADGGRRIAFVGDGINDAPALAAADVGLAVGTGTDIAMESADVVVMSGDLRAVANAVALSHATIRNIRQNLFWAFAYNVCLVPVAAGVLYPAYGVLLSPVLAAGAMVFSSVFVLTNALRLKRFRPVAGAGAGGNEPVRAGQSREVRA